MLSLPGSAFARAMRSGTVFTGNELIDVQNLIAAAKGGDRSNFAGEIDGAIERGVDHVVRRNDQKRVTVRRRARHHLGSDIGGSTRPILDYECLTEPLLQPLRHQAR